jgi:hypothetical protein
MVMLDRQNLKSKVEDRSVLTSNTSRANDTTAVTQNAASH